MLTSPSWFALDISLPVVIQHIPIHQPKSMVECFVPCKKFLVYMYHIFLSSLYFVLACVTFVLAESCALVRSSWYICIISMVECFVPCKKFLVYMYHINGRVFCPL